MKTRRVSFVQRLLIAISKVVPQSERNAWLEEWHSEIWHWRKGRVASSRPPSTVALFLRALSAAPHALWVRRDSRRPGRTPHRDKSNVFGAFLGDIKYAVRSLRKSPGFALAAILTLALGIGANAAMFTVVNGVVLRSLPYPDSHSLFLALYSNPTRGRAGLVSRPDFDDIVAAIDGIEGMTAFPGIPFSGVVLTGSGEPEELETGYVSDAFFNTLDVTMLLGRGFRPGEDEPGANDVVVLSEDLWRRRYGADPGIVGRTIGLEGRPFTVTGVAPASVRLPSADIDVWTPLSQISTESIPHQNRWLRWLLVVARVKPDVTTETAQSELTALATGLDELYPGTHDGWNAVTLRPLQNAIVGDTRASLFLLLGAVGFVLLIACANVANLLLARATNRAHEMAIRTALGATHGRIARLALTESLLLAGMGGAVGLALAVIGVDVFVALASDQLPRAGEISLDGWVLAFVTFVSVATGLVFGVLPTRAAVRGDVHSALRQGGRDGAPGRWRGVLRRGLVVSEVALAVVLVIGSGLLLKSLDRLTAVDPGFDADNVLTVSFTFPDYAYDYGSGAFLRDYDRVLEAVRQTPGVLSAGVVHQMPVVSADEGTGFAIPGVEPPEGDRFSALFRAVSPGYFATMGIPLLAGRDVAESDHADAPRAIVINRAMAERFWPDKSPVGTWIDVWAGTAQIVGVVGNVRHGGFATEPQATIYISNTQLSRRRLILMVRTATDPSHLEAAVRGAIRQVVPEQPIRRIAPLTDVLSETVSASRLTTVLLSSFAALALVLAAVGIYGVISYTVSQRTREMGIRMTLGARYSDVLRLVIRQGLTMTAIGTAGGLLVSVVLSRILSGMLFEVSGTDPLVLSSVTVGAIVVATLACYVPARRATRADPVQALRNE